MTLASSTAAPARRANRAPSRGYISVRNLWKSLQWAWLDTICQYRRSRIGPLWETINLMVTLVGLTVVSSAIFGASVWDIVAYVGLGIIIWSAISSLMNDGSGTFVRNAGYVMSSTLPIDLYVGRSIFRTMITFAHHTIIYFIGVVFGVVTIGWTSLLAIPGIVLLFANGFWVVTVLGYICTRFRDVDLFVRNIMQLAFFVTPVFWSYQRIAPNRRFLVEYNPFFYFIDIVRTPLLGEVPPAWHYAVVLGVTVCGYALAYYVHRRMRGLLAFCV
jgi:ABC-type polysaccharide/polyol phosphate export permease